VILLLLVAFAGFWGAADLDRCRAELRRWPDHEEVLRVSAFWKESVDAARKAYRPNWMLRRMYMAESLRLMEPWDRLGAAQRCVKEGDARGAQKALREMRQHLGEDDWWNGRLPLPIPGWSLSDKP
jgi:hypothetical protein